MNRNSNYPYLSILTAIFLASGLWLLSSCSTTKAIPEGDQLYTGLQKIQYTNYEENKHFVSTQEELEAALACEPNGALLGSSYYRTPFPISLWIWNAFSGSTSGVGKWIGKTFGKKPVLMSWVNPALRAQVAQTVLKTHGYFQGKVKYNIITQRHPKKAKIAYTVDMGHLYTLDSIAYLNFAPAASHLLDSTKSEAKIRRGDAFEVATLDAERTRISTLFRNNGHFYYQPGYASYLADTIEVDGKVQLKILPDGNTPPTAKRKWYIGHIDLQLRKQFMQELTDSVSRRNITIHYRGKHSPIRPRVIFRDVKLRPGQLYSYDNYLQSYNKLTDMGLFSLVDFKFTPRDASATCDTLDLELSCVFDKPYDFYVETNYTGKTNGRMGPGIIVGFGKRNAFRGGEKLDISANGSYEWQTGGRASEGLNSYEYGASASLEFPQLLVPFRIKRRFFSTPSSLLKVSTSVINRGSYFKRHIVSGELTYNLQTTATSLHQFSPLTLQYNYMTSHTATFDSIMNANPYLKVTMKDVFIPKMRYSYIYTNPATYRHPIWWQTTISEASNLLSLGNRIGGRKWSEKDKTMFKNPYAQFFKIETEWRKTWQTSEHTQLVAHFGAGIIWSYGNSSVAPYSEQFYVGGANSIRAFTVRSIGPGSFYPTSSANSYLDQTGDIKLLFNLEYRPRLLGNLYGAIFLDAGNIWAMHSYDSRPNSTFQLKNLAKEMALGTGIGLRYDLDFFVLRLDWGFGLHLPYKQGFYNITSWRDAQSIHLAIGYPF